MFLENVFLEMLGGSKYFLMRCLLCLETAFTTCFRKRGLVFSGLKSWNFLLQDTVTFGDFSRIQGYTWYDTSRLSQEVGHWVIIHLYNQEKSYDIPIVKSTYTQLRVMKVGFIYYLLWPKEPTSPRFVFKEVDLLMLLNNTIKVPAFEELKLRLRP